MCLFTIYVTSNNNANFSHDNFSMINVLKLQINVLKLPTHFPFLSFPHKLLR